MDKEELKQMILEILKEQALSSLAVPYHTHTQTDAGQLDPFQSLTGFFKVVNTIPTLAAINLADQIKLYYDTNNSIYTLYFYDTSNKVWIKIPFADIIGGSHISIAKTTNATTINYAP